MRLQATRRFSFPANSWVNEGDIFDAKDYYGKVLLAVGFAIPAPEPKETKPKRQKYMTRRLEADDEIALADDK